MAADSGGGAAPFASNYAGSVNFHPEAGGQHKYKVLPGRYQTARRTDFWIAMETNALKPSTKTTECRHSTAVQACNYIPAGVGYGGARQLKSCLTLENRGEPLILRLATAA